MTGQFYTDTLDGDQLWIDSHQGGAYSGAQRVQRFWTGTDQLFPCIGSDSFRVLTQTVHGPDLGEVLRAVSPSSGALSTRVAPIGIIDDPNARCGRYIYLMYGESAGSYVVSSVMSYDSSWDDELNVATSPVQLWTPPYQYPNYVEAGMRVVNLGKDTDNPSGRTFLYYLLTTGLTSRLLYVPLPDPGEAATVTVPIPVAELPFEATDRMYLVAHEDGTVSVYLSEGDLYYTRQTFHLRHDPVANSVIDSLASIMTGAMVFPRSYGACLGPRFNNETPVHLLLEPLTSWDGGGAALPQSRPGGFTQLGVSGQANTGNSWLLVTASETGRSVLDTITSDVGDVKPYMAATAGVDAGGVAQVIVRPTALALMREEKDADDDAVPENEITSAHMLHCAARLRTMDSEADDTYLYLSRETSLVAGYRPNFGQNKETAQVWQLTSRPNIGRAFSEEMSLLVPGSIRWDFVGARTVPSYHSVSTLPTAANRLGSWTLADDSNYYGEIGVNFTVPTVPTHNPRHNPSCDTVQGVKARNIDDETTIVAGWVYNPLNT